MVPFTIHLPIAEDRDGVASLVNLWLVTRGEKPVITRAQTLHGHTSEPEVLVHHLREYHWTDRENVRMFLYRDPPAAEECFQQAAPSPAIAQQLRRLAA